MIYHLPELHDQNLLIALLNTNTVLLVYHLDAFNSTLYDSRYNAILKHVQRRNSFIPAVSLSITKNHPPNDGHHVKTLQR